MPKIHLLCAAAGRRRAIVCESGLGGQSASLNVAFCVPERRVLHAQLYGDEEMHDDVRERCLDYIAQEREHFGQFITEEFDQVFVFYPWDKEMRARDDVREQCCAFSARVSTLVFFAEQYVCIQCGRADRRTGKVSMCARSLLQ